VYLQITKYHTEGSKISTLQAGAHDEPRRKQGGGADARARTKPKGFIQPGSRATHISAAGSHPTGRKRTPRTPAAERVEEELEERERERARRDGAGAYKWAVLNPRRKKSQPPDSSPVCLLRPFPTIIAPWPLPRRIIISRGASNLGEIPVTVTASPRKNSARHSTRRQGQELLTRTNTPCDENRNQPVQSLILSIATDGTANAGHGSVPACFCFRCSAPRHRILHSPCVLQSCQQYHQLVYVASLVVIVHGWIGGLDKMCQPTTRLLEHPTPWFSNRGNGVLYIWNEESYTYLTGTKENEGERALHDA
jgi:hypothetical protein